MYNQTHRFHPIKSATRDKCIHNLVTHGPGYFEMVNEGGTGLYVASCRTEDYIIQWNDHLLFSNTKCLIMKKAFKIQISLSISNTVFDCNYDIESSYQKRKKMYRWIHVRLFLESPKNTQVIMYTLLTCQWYQLHLTRFCILLPCLFITYKNSICFIGFHVLHVNKNLT